MSRDRNVPTPASIARYVGKHEENVKQLLTTHHHGIPETFREAQYKGHHIIIGTSYRIEVDHRPIDGDFIVTDDGQVQCHALPNYTFLSALDTVKTLIDTFPEDFVSAGEHHDHDSRHDPDRGAHRSGQGKRTAGAKKKRVHSRKGD